MPARDLLRSALTLLLMACAALAVAACGGKPQEEDPRLRGEWLTIYSSLPQHGPGGPVAADVLAAQRLALEQAGARAGPYRVRIVALDASSPVEGRTDPTRISENARRASADETTIAYLGELANGMSAVSIPLLNEAGILQVSPLDGAMTLTTGSSAATGTPERFYPRLDDVGRTFARVVPSDRSQAAALLAFMRAERVRRLAVLTDEDPNGRALAELVRTRAPEAGVTLVAREEIDIHAREHADAIARVVEARPDAVLDATGGRAGSARLWRELARGVPEGLLFAPASLADPDFLAHLGPAESRARITRPRHVGRVQEPGARRFERAFRERFGRRPAPEARYGYESMRSVLAALERAAGEASDGRVSRADLVREYFRTSVRDGVLGAYAIDAVGDTSLERWGAFRVLDGELRFAGPLRLEVADGEPAGPAPAPARQGGRSRER